MVVPEEVSGRPYAAAVSELAEQFDRVVTQECLLSFREQVREPGRDLDHDPHPARARTTDEPSRLLHVRTCPRLSPGSTAIIADVAEPAIEVVDGEMAKLSGEVTRRPEDDVMAELEAAEEATEAAAKEARRKMREQRKAEVSEKFSERVGKLKDRLHIS